MQSQEKREQSGKSYLPVKEEREGTGCPIKSGVMDINIKRDNIPQ